MALEGVVFFVLTLLLEQGFFIHKLASCFARRKIEAAEVQPNEVRSNYFIKCVCAVRLLVACKHVCGAPAAQLLQC